MLRWSRAVGERVGHGAVRSQEDAAFGLVASRPAPWSGIRYSFETYPGLGSSVSS